MIKVEPSSNPECSWEGYNSSDNCNFLKEAVNAARSMWSMSIDVIRTVFSTARIWKQFFGNSCDTFAADTVVMVSYANYDNTGHVNSTPSFDDFEPFGGWTAGSVLFKQIGGNVTVPLLCGSTKWHAFVD